MLPDSAVLERHARFTWDRGWHVEAVAPGELRINDRLVVAGERVALGDGDLMHVGPYLLLAGDGGLPPAWTLGSDPSPGGTRRVVEPPGDIGALPDLSGLLDLPADPLALFSGVDDLHRGLLDAAGGPAALVGMSGSVPQHHLQESTLASDYSRAAAMDDGAMGIDSHFATSAAYSVSHESVAGGELPARPAPSLADAAFAPSDARWLPLVRAFAAGAGAQGGDFESARVTPELMHTVGTLVRYLQHRLQTSS